MVENENFYRMVAGISIEERLGILSRLKSQSLLTREPLYFDEPSQKSSAGSKNASMAERYASLSWFSRIWYFFLSLFRGKQPSLIYQDRVIAALGRQIDETSPGLYDFQTKRLLPMFYANLEKLKEAARFFYTALDMGITRDKGAFYAFLASLEMAPVHERLQTETDPAFVKEKNSPAPEEVESGTAEALHESELRRLCYQAMEDALAGVNEEYRNAMYANARSLLCLRQLASFLFDRLMLSFSHDSALKGKTCSVSTVKDLLLSLNNILVSLKTIPPMPLLETLFVFLLQDRMGEEGINMDREIRLLLSKAESALLTIREFNRRTPLTKIMRCAFRDLSITPQEISGGEDWFLVYRDYWKQHIDDAFAEHIRKERYDELMKTFRQFMHGTALTVLKNAASDGNPDGIPIKGSFGLSFLLTFFSAVFVTDIDLVLQPILEEGIFVHKENRQEFSESYTEFMKMETNIRSFEDRLSPSGDYGKRYSLAMQEMAALPVKRRKIQIVLEEASSEALGIIDGIRKASRSMIDLIYMIVGREGRGNKNDVLSNLDRLAAKQTAFVSLLNNSAGKFQTVIQILNDIDVMETGI